MGRGEPARTASAGPGKSFVPRTQSNRNYSVACLDCFFGPRRCVRGVYVSPTASLPDSHTVSSLTLALTLVVQLYSCKALWHSLSMMSPRSYDESLASTHPTFRTLQHDTSLRMGVSCTLFVVPFACSPETVAAGAFNADCSTHAGAGAGVGAHLPFGGCVSWGISL